MFTLHVHDLISPSGDGGDGAAKPVGAVWVSAFVCATPLDILKGDLSTISSCVGNTDAFDGRSERLSDF